MEKAKESAMFSEINAVMPGFINLKIAPEYLAGYMNRMAEDPKYGLEETKEPETIIVDYGGANVAKLFTWDICALQLSERALSASAAIWDIR